MKTLLIAGAFAALAGYTAPAQGVHPETVDAVFGRKGTVQGDVARYTFPRSDLRVTAGDIVVEPGLALTSWAAFRTMGTQTMMMGDLVLLDAELGGVEKTLAAGGIEISAIHNHIINESPPVKYLHFGGHGDAVRLAETLMSALRTTATPLGASPPPPPAAAGDWSAVESILGRKGHATGDIAQFSFPRADAVSEAGMEIPPAMGMATAINFQRAGDRSAVTGDFVLEAGEVQAVIAALAANGITVTALHNHMLHESPRLFFLHFWGVDAPDRLARALRSALDKVHIAAGAR